MSMCCWILLQSAHGFRFCEGSKFAISHWLGRSPLTQCWRYRAACDEITALAVFPAVEAEMKFHCMASAEITFHFLWVDTAWCTRVSHFPEWGVECSVFPIIANKNKCEWLILAIFSRPLRSALDKWTTFPSVCLSVCLFVSLSVSLSVCLSAATRELWLKVDFLRNPFNVYVTGKRGTSVCCKKSAKIFAMLYRGCYIEGGIKSSDFVPICGYISKTAAVRSKVTTPYINSYLTFRLATFATSFGDS